MKKMAFLVAILSVLAFPLYSYGVEGPVTPPAVGQPPKVEPKEFISQEVPKEVQGLLETLEFAFQVEVKMYYSGKVPGVNDYALIYADTGHGAVQVLFKLALKKDEKGNIIPGEVVSEVMAYVFVDKKVSWYQSADAKAIFEKATK